MKVVRIDLQGACEPMEFESKKALKEYLIDFHLQDYHEEDEFGVEDIKLIKSFSLDQICDYFDWGYENKRRDNMKNILVKLTQRDEGHNYRDSKNKARE
jgi:hypothetical protein